MAINFPTAPTTNQTYTYNGRTWTYNGVGWQATGASGLSVYTKTGFTATAAQTTFTVAYTLGFVDVYYNGSKLSTTEYTATNGTSVVLGTACSANDIVETIAWTVSTTLNPALGVATATSLALGGATIGANALAVTGTTNLAGLVTATTGISSTLTTDATSDTTGSIVTAGGISMQKALWVGTTSRHVGAVTMNAALTYGGITLSNAVTGTGNMVLSASPTLTGTLTAATGTFSGLITASAGVSSTLTTDATSATTGSIITAGGISTQKALWVGTTSRHVGATQFDAAITYGGITLSNAVTGTGNMVLSASPTLTGTLTAAAGTFSGAVTGASFIPSSATIPTNGLYLSAANTPSISVNGALAATFSDSVNRVEITAKANTSINFRLTGTDATKDYAIRATDGTNGWIFGLDNATVGAGGFGILTNSGTVRFSMTQAGAATFVSNVTATYFTATAAATNGLGLAAANTPALYASTTEFMRSTTSLTTFALATTHTGATTLSAALTYGGITLSNAVTGTGNMVLSASPTLTGTLTAAAGTFSGTFGATGAATFGSTIVAASATFGAGTVQSLTTPLIWARNSAVNLEWGNSSTSGYASQMGSHNASGKTFVSFQCIQGTNAATYKTTGALVGRVIESAPNGNLVIGHVPTASTDNQALTADITIDTAGLVGIGMTTPGSNNVDIGSAKLYVANSAANSDGIVCEGDAAGRAGLVSIQQNYTNLSASAFGRVDVGAGTSNGYIQAYKSDPGGPAVTSLRLQPSGGAVGIGMTPVNVLDITQTQDAASIIGFKNASTGTSGRTDLRLYNSTNLGIVTLFGTGFTSANVLRAGGVLLQGDGAGGVTLNTGAAQPIYFGINSAEKMRLSAAALLIGATTYVATSSEKLGIYSGGISVRMSADSTLGFIGYTTANSNTYFSFRKNWDSTFDETGSISYNGSVVAYNTTSDAELKNIIGDATASVSLNILRKTRMRDYEWKHAPGKTHIGPIAQELYEVFGGAVTPGRETVDPETKRVIKSHWSVDRTAFSNHLVIGWQEHDRRIDELTALNQELTTRLAALENKS